MSLQTQNYKIKLHIFGQEHQISCRKNIKDEELNKCFTISKKFKGNGYMLIKASQLKCPMSEIQYNLANPQTE